jgi:hypothetical protein
LGPRESGFSRRVSQSWQKRALDYIDLIPECNYASRFYARMMKQLIIYPGNLDTEGKITPIEDGLPVEVLDRIQDPGGGRSQLLGNYGRLMFATGEGYLFGRELETEDEKWAFVWNDELDFADGRILWKPNESEMPKEFAPGQAVAYRMWSSSPARSGEADSPMRAALDIAEELVILTQAVRATAVSRMTNGAFLVPQEISPGAAESIGDEDPENDPFLADMIEHWTGQIENAGSPEATLPWLLSAAYEYLDRIRWVPMHDPQNDYLERDLRKEAVERLARGFDMPPEVLLGLSDANHWAARQILDDMWRSHGAPIAEQFCDDLNEAYLRPALREANYEGWSTVVIGYDETNVVIKPDRGQSAIDAWNVGAIGSKAVRRDNGYTEDDAMSDEERDIWLAIKMRDPQLLPSDVAPPLRGPTPAPGSPAPADQGPPAPGPEGVSRQERTASARIIGAAEMALLRCREVAGSRILSYRNSCPDCLQPAADAPKALVAAVLGQDVLAELNVPQPMKLVTGGTDGFRSLLTDWGFSTSQAEALCEMVTVYAAKTLFDRNHPALPSGFAAQVERMQEVSDAVGHQAA